jgi:hypothetical protein
MGGRGNGGCQLQSCGLTGDKTTASRGGREQDTTRGGGRGGGKLADVRGRCHKRQCGNQFGQTRGTVAHQEAAVLTRGQEVEAAQQDVMQQPAGANEGGGLRMDM